MAQIITCPKCKGKGYVIRIHKLMALCSLGISALIEASDPPICDSCNGKGYIKVKTNDE